MDSYHQILNLFSSQGIWAVLSVLLILYILKNQEQRDIKQEERELNYQKIISDLTNKLSIIERIESNIKEIKTAINQKK